MSFFEFPHTRTYDSDLGWLIKDYDTLNDAIAALNSWKEETQPTIDELKELYLAIASGNLPEGMREGMLAWCERHIPDIIARALKTVFFTLENGYFCAWIPDSWDEITFGTSGLDDFPAGVDFGHLTLSY